ncbi:MAG: YggS family pyridoxal phosphate-dependent enzyme [Bacteroidota bacterium]
MPVRENIQYFKSELPANVTLVAVSKTKPLTMLQEAYDAGQKDFGENYVQELVDKQVILPNDIRWHFIGHLQSNKVKYIAPFVYLIHGVDSISLLKEINKQAQKNNRIIHCLLQLHIAEEETKFGFSIEEVTQFLQSGDLDQYKHISVKGFMAMASNTEDETKIRIEFKQVKHLQTQFPELTILSFGMSSDYKIAIEEGSTMVRIGSSIFGERDYSK